MQERENLNILILDDCTSALDSKTESALWDHLHKVLPDMTAILITHRADTLEKTDKIFVFEFFLNVIFFILALFSTLILFVGNVFTF
jgi:ABC-type multidrug transport system fused ATPase/permease subunit